MANSGNNIPRKIITISIWKAILVVVTAVLGSAGASIWGTLAVANTIPFRVSAIETEIIDIKKDFMPYTLSIEKWTTNEKEHVAIGKKLDVIEIKIDAIRNLIK